jgi:hypothetical protein
VAVIGRFDADDTLLQDHADFNLEHVRRLAVTVGDIQRAVFFNDVRRLSADLLLVVLVDLEDPALTPVLEASFPSPYFGASGGRSHEA